MKYSLYIWSFRILNETAILGFKMKTLFVYFRAED